MLIQFSKNWWVLLINGIIALLLGLFCIFSPEGTLITLARYFGFLVILAGIILGIGAMDRMRKKENFTWLLIEAIIIIILGAIILLYTEQSLSIFAIILGVWAIAMGILQFMILASIKDEIENKSIILINSIVTIGFGIALFFNPFTGMKIVTILIGVAALIMGILMIMVSFNIKKVQEDN